MVSKDYFKKWNPNVNYRSNPHLYRIGRGQQGVLICEPYKSEICAHWRFKTVPEAKVSSQKILEMFYDFVKQGDFVGADMAKKFLQRSAIFVLSSSSSTAVRVSRVILILINRY